jgi:hypothetical protein
MELGRDQMAWYNWPACSTAELHDDVAQLRFCGRAALVMGAGRGPGRAVALALAASFVGRSSPVEACGACPGAP